LPVCKLGDIEYWCGGDAKAKVAAAIVGDQIVMAMAPAGLEDRVFGLALGRDKPASSLADSAAFEQLLADWQLGAFSAGFVDIKAIVELALGEGDPLGREVMA